MVAARTRGERNAQWILVAFFLLFSFVTVYPFLNALAYSLSDPIEAYRGISIFPRKPTLLNYRLVFRRGDVFPAAFISLLRTILGVATHVLICGLASYALSRRDLVGSRTLTVFLIVPMYVFPGLIPVYVNIYRLGLMNSFWVYVVPHLFSAYNMLVMRTYFAGIPFSLTESAYIDGANDFTILWRVIVPLSAPIIAVIALWQGVWQWNSWFDAMLYVNNVRLHPLAMLLQRIIRENEMADTQIYDSFGSGTVISPQGLRMAMLVITTAPIVLIYPFFQRYFIKGVMIGAVKG